MRRLQITLGFFVSMSVVFSSCSKHDEYRYNATYQRTDIKGIASSHYVYDYKLSEYELTELQVEDSIAVSNWIPTAYNFNVELQSINGVIQK